VIGMKKQFCSSPAAATFIALLLVAIWAVTATAQEPDPHSRPTLYGHGFTETVDTPSPFVRSFVRNRLGAGKAFDLTTTVNDLNGEPIIGLTGDLLFAVLDFEYQYAIKPWIALRTRVVGAGRLGTDTMALLSEGVTMSTGFEFGWLVRLHEHERTALALDLNIGNRMFTGVNIATFYNDIVAGKPAELVKKTPSTRASAGLRFAWAVSPLVGFTTNVITGFGESIDRSSSDDMFWRLSGAFDFDLRTKLDFPMGVAVGQTYDTFPEFGGDIADGVHATFLRFSYLGREDFLMSLDVSYDRIPLQGNKDDLKGATVTIGLRYYI
jgi:hypothetical protein